MEMRFSPKLRRCHLLLNSVFFKKPGRFPRLITVIVPRCERSCQPVIQVSMICCRANEELHAIEQHCGRQRASDPGLLAVAASGDRKSWSLSATNAGFARGRLILSLR